MFHQALYFITRIIRMMVTLQKTYTQSLNVIKGGGASVALLLDKKVEEPSTPKMSTHFALSKRLRNLLSGV